MSLKLLIIGGTQFVGRHLVDAALLRGDDITLFNRGQTSAQVPAGVRFLRGDRKGDLSALAGGPWDAVIDTCGYLPVDVQRMARHLDAQVGSYVFVSSVSAYASTAQSNDEDSALASLPPDEAARITEMTPATYGPLKALCEQAVQSVLGPQRCTLVRPGLIVGPHDPTGRFTWWPARWHQAAGDGQAVLAPGVAPNPLQFIDVRDLATWLLHLVDAGATGAFNAVSPPGLFNWGDLMACCAQAAGVALPPVWVPEELLLDEGVGPWMELPLWIPSVGPNAAEHAGFMASVTERAQAWGLQTRPLAHTVADTLAWWRSLPDEARRFAKTGLSAEREARLRARLRG
jgi:2'-hydroxyisoflavone reductase